MATYKIITIGTSAVKEIEDDRYSYAPQREIQQEEKTKPVQKKAVRTRAAARTSNKTALSVLSVVAVVLVVLNILSYAMLLELSEGTSAAQNKYSQLVEENTVLRVKYDQTFNMNEIEEYAVNVLGMTRPITGQQEKIQTETTDKIIVHTEEAAIDSGFFKHMSEFISKLLSYFFS